MGLRGSSPVMKTNTREQLARAFEEFKRFPFPPSGSGNKDLEDAHASLILYDSAVAGVVDSILDSPTLSRQHEQQLMNLQDDGELELMIDRLIEKYSDSQNVGGVARQYAAYLERIKRVLRAADSYLHSIGQ